jgi:hypothetical protein
MHCPAGLGRTGLFRASLARRTLGLSGTEAIPWVRHVLPHAVETPEQQRLLLQDEGVKEPGTRGEHTGGCMSNTHGHLPKAERAQLPAELQQRLAVWTTKAYTDDNLFLTLARSPGVLEMFLHWAAFMYTGISRLDPSTMELCRLRLAARNHCVH